jgi:expansin (peptidoglycan-binding protein)
MGKRAWGLGLFFVAFVSFVAFVAACGSSSKGGHAGPIATAPTDSCGSLRMTYYDASKSGWCEFDRTLSILPDFVRAGLTTAVAEPWNGGSYGGVAGESCGECWEVATLGGTRTLMVHDLCPIAGNPVCAGDHFHFDLSSESAQALDVNGINEGSARRVSCPVTGNAYLQLLDRNQWGYVRFQVVNHRIPVRNVEFRAVGGGTWYPARRSGGAWDIPDHGDGFASGGAGGVFRLTSAQGETMEMPNTLTYAFAIGSVFDLGAQLTDQAASGGAVCTFEPPPVYIDAYGGITNVKWQMNPWGNAKASETTTNCKSGSCIRVQGLAGASGFHIYYPHTFATTLWKSLTLNVRAEKGAGRLQVAASNDGQTCTMTSVDLSEAYAAVTLDLATTCASQSELNAITVYGDASLTTLFDDVVFVH